MCARERERERKYINGSALLARLESTTDHDQVIGDELDYANEMLVRYHIAMESGTIVETGASVDILSDKGCFIPCVSGPTRR